MPAPAFPCGRRSCRRRYKPNPPGAGEMRLQHAEQRQTRKPRAYTERRSTQKAEQRSMRETKSGPTAAAAAAPPHTKREAWTAAPSRWQAVPWHAMHQGAAAMASAKPGVRRDAGRARQQPAGQRRQPAALATSVALPAGAGAAGRVPAAGRGRGKAAAGQARGCQATACSQSRVGGLAEHTDEAGAHASVAGRSVCPGFPRSPTTLPAHAACWPPTCNPAVLQRLLGRHAPAGLPHQAALRSRGGAYAGACGAGAAGGEPHHAAHASRAAAAGGGSGAPQQPPSKLASAPPAGSL